MEVATTIRINGKDYCKLVDPDKVKHARVEIIALGKLILEDQKKNQSQHLNGLK
jgi:hypothetical protein